MTLLKPMIGFLMKDILLPGVALLYQHRDGAAAPVPSFNLSTGRQCPL
jgi:hypothetical protein